MVVIDRIAKDASTEKGTNTVEPITDVMNKPNNPYCSMRPIISYLYH